MLDSLVNARHSIQSQESTISPTGGVVVAFSMQAILRHDRQVQHPTIDQVKAICLPIRFDILRRDLLAATDVFFRRRFVCMIFLSLSD